MLLILKCYLCLYDYCCSHACACQVYVHVFVSFSVERLSLHCPAMAKSVSYNRQTKRPSADKPCTTLEKGNFYNFYEF